MSSGPLVVEHMNVSPCSKRKREEGRYAVDLGAHARGANPHSSLQSEVHDCFSEALAGNFYTTNGSLHSSWLTTSHTWTRESILHSTRRHYGVISLQQQIAATQHQLLQLKKRFGPAAQQCAGWYHSTPAREFQEARERCNPYEPLHGKDNTFLNRAGLKLANIDALLQYSLTNINNNNTLGDFTFVDLCGAPGGFSEYLMKRCQSNPTIHSCRGWGMSLEGVNHEGQGVEWKLQHVLNDNVNGTYIHYAICHGNDGTGNVYQWENIEALQQQVLAESSCCGAQEEPGKVHLVVADGGVDAQRNAPCQETVASKLVVCQVSAALSLLRKNGMLLIKMFGFQTSTIRTMMKSLLDLFHQVTVVKPITSRPASAERYVVFEGFKGMPPHLDGRKWQSLMLQQTQTATADTFELEMTFMDCLDECDCDILQLNQKACFEILSYLERKTMGQAASAMGNTLEPPCMLDMEAAYQNEWCLDSLL